MAVKKPSVLSMGIIPKEWANLPGRVYKERNMPSEPTRKRLPPGMSSPLGGMGYRAPSSGTVRYFS